MLITYPKCPKCNGRTEPYSLTAFRCAECGQVATPAERSLLLKPVRGKRMMRPIETDPRSQTAGGANG